jgi:hypothetical protein
MRRYRTKEGRLPKRDERSSKFELALKDLKCQQQSVVGDWQINYGHTAPRLPVIDKTMRKQRKTGHSATSEVLWQIKEQRNCVVP